MSSKGLSQNLLLLLTLAILCCHEVCHGFTPSKPRIGLPRRTTTTKLAMKGTFKERFDRKAPTESQSQEPCILYINNVACNVTAWAKAHPGGEQLLHKYHGRNATKAFDAAGHSTQAVQLLQQFAIDSHTTTSTSSSSTVQQDTTTNNNKLAAAAWRNKLFTKEDPIGLHKYLGLFVLLHYVVRFQQMYFGDPSCGMGSRLGQGAKLLPALCLIPHALLSLSSLIFDTVPRERVVGRPMIWAEYRIHNIAFGLRTLLATALAWASYYFGHAPIWRKIAIGGSCVAVVAAQVAADLGTKKLRVDTAESTTATMPYWEGCSTTTQKRFKSFYAYCQFMAAITCLAAGNPAWPFSTLIAIQMASFLMTLVRKGLLSARGYHIGYTITLVMPWFVGLRTLVHGPEVILTGSIAMLLYQLRRQGINKYLLWAPIIAARILWADPIDQLYHCFAY